MSKWKALFQCFVVTFNQVFVYWATEKLFPRQNSCLSSLIHLFLLLLPHVLLLLLKDWSRKSILFDMVLWGYQEPLEEIRKTIFHYSCRCCLIFSLKFLLKLSTWKDGFFPFFRDITGANESFERQFRKSWKREDIQFTLAQECFLRLPSRVLYSPISLLKLTRRTFKNYRKALAKETFYTNVTDVPPTLLRENFLAGAFYKFCDILWKTTPEVDTY